MTTETFRIAPDHPSLPGHFPGRPIVPGVVLLDRVARSFERSTGRTIAALPQVKFLSPVLPGEEIELELVPTPTRVRFVLRRAGTTVASGELVPA